MTQKQCCVCHNPDGPGGAELAPYGPNSSDICFHCATLPENRHDTFLRIMKAIEPPEDDPLDLSGMTMIILENGKLREPTYAEAVELGDLAESLRPLK